jgi:hypothetical protein
MSVPNHAQIVRDVAAAHPELLTRNTRASCAEFLQRVIAALPRNEPWGYVSKSSGENGYTFSNGVRVAIDVIAYRDPYTQIDVLVNAAANDDNDPATSGSTSPDWRPIDPRLYRPGNVWVDPAIVPPLGTPGPSPGHVCRLGASWFWMMAGLKFWPDQVMQNLEWLAANMSIDYTRVIAVVGGDTFVAPDGSRADPWAEAGAWLSWPDHGALLERVTDLLFDYGIKTEWTLIGGLGQIPRDADQDAMVDHVVRHLRDREHKLQVLEIMNEYHINGGGNVARLRRLARRVRAGLRSVDLSLSTPNCGAPAEQIAREVEAMYRDLPEANAITPHWDRADHVAPPLGPWSPPRRYSNEPRGPGASTGGHVTDPATLARDYRAALGADYVGYVFHSDWGIWDRHLHPKFVTTLKGVTTNVWEIERMPAIAAALTELRRTMGQEPRPPRPGPRPSHALRSREALRGDEALVSGNGQYQLLYQLDGNLVVYGLEGATWSSGTEGHSVGSLEMQGDGNLVLYDANGRPLRATRTEGNPGAMVQLQDDGKLVVYADPNGPQAGTPLRDVTSEFYALAVG